MRLLPLAALLLVALLPSSVSAQQGDPVPGRRGSILTVRGEGRFEQRPDYARFTVAVSTQGRTLDATIAAHREGATRAVAVLKGLADTTIESSSFQTTEQVLPNVRGPRDATDQPAKLPENPFTATTAFVLKVGVTEALNDTVSRIAGIGLFQLRKIDFKVEKERAALNEARRAAMTDAREQAKAYAESGDISLVEIIEITDGEARPYSDGEADLPRSLFVQVIPPARVAFEASVNVTWRIAPR